MFVRTTQSIHFVSFKSLIFNFLDCSRDLQNQSLHFKSTKQKESKLRTWTGLNSNLQTAYLSVISVIVRCSIIEWRWQNKGQGDTCICPLYFVRFAAASNSAVETTYYQATVLDSPDCMSPPLLSRYRRLSHLDLWIDCNRIALSLDEDKVLILIPSYYTYIMVDRLDNYLLFYELNIMILQIDNIQRWTSSYREECWYFWNICLANLSCKKHLAWYLKMV